MSLEFTVVVCGQIADGGTKISTIPGMAPPSAIQRIGNGFSGGCGHEGTSCRAGRFRYRLFALFRIELNLHNPGCLLGCHLELPLENRVRRRLNQHWISSRRSYGFDTPIGSNHVELDSSRDVGSLGQYRIHRMTFSITLCSMGLLPELEQSQAITPSETHPTVITKAS